MSKDVQAIVLHNQTVSDVATKTKLLAVVFDVPVTNITIQVKGTFRDERQELAFCNTSYVDVDVLQFKRKWLCLTVDGVKDRYCAVDDNIATVQFTIEC